MKQITEDYVSYEIAKRLKEKGFDGECIAYYSIYKDNNASLYRWRNKHTYVNVKNAGYTIVPTHQMALKWLREVYNIFVEISVDEMLADKGYQWVLFYNDTKIIRPYAGWGDTYEQAVEAAILYVLKNLI